MSYKLNIQLTSLFQICLLLILLGNVNINASGERDLTKNIRAITQFIASAEFKAFKLNNSDYHQLDLIFTFALTQCKFDTSEALLALTFATLPYNRIPVKVPLTNIRLEIPIYSDEDSVFLLKNELLPSNFYLDTPKGKLSDTDKPAHFFGSAFLSYSSNIIDLTMVIGYFVELIEVFFNSSDEADLRDMRTNELGKFFGQILRDGIPTSPSSVFLSYNLNHILKYGIHLNH